MAANFSPCKESYVLNRFPRNVMFDMNGFNISASVVIQGHHGSLVLNSTLFFFNKFMTTWNGCIGRIRLGISVEEGKWPESDAQ